MGFFWQAGCPFLLAVELCGEAVAQLRGLHQVQLFGFVEHDEHVALVPAFVGVFVFSH